MEKSKFEVEYRGLLEDGQYFQLRERLEKDSVDFSEDHKISYFFVVSGFVLKINDETTNNCAKIVMKLGHETGSVFEEIEVRMTNREDVESIIRIFNVLGFDKVNKVPQLRYNYAVDEKIVISLKHTPDFGYHFEIEGVADGSDDVETVRNGLMVICKKFGLRPLNEEEMSRIIKRINKKHGFAN